MEKKNIVILIGAVIICIVAIIIVNRDSIFTKQTSDTEMSSVEGNMGDFEAEEQTEEEEEELMDIPFTMDEEYDYIAQEYIYITNLDLVYDLLTIQALQDIESETYDFLNAHGYGESHELTIIEDSIIWEKSYPCFEAKIEGIEGKVIEIRYDLRNQEFEFQFLEK